MNFSRIFVKNKSYKMGREKIDESKKKIRIDVFIEKEKCDLLGKKFCAEISKEEIEKEYRKQLKSKKA